MNAPPPRVAYLINHYPKVSHSFIRREILALERQGLTVMRIAMRGWDDVLVDPDDQRERLLTRYVLQRGLAAPLRAAAWLAWAKPARFFAALKLALTMWRGSQRSCFHHLAYLAEACEIVGWLATERINHLHAHFGTNPAEVAMLARVLGGPPYSFTLHGPEEFDQPVALGLAAKSRHAAFVVAISSFGRSQLYRWLPLADWGKVQVVRCGLDKGFYLSAPRGGTAAARLVCVGRLCEQKGQLLLIEAAARVVASGLALELVLAGDGEMRPEIEASIDRLGLHGCVRITGWISSVQVRSELLGARALVLPSFAEGLPVVVMEAMALHRPVITTSVAGIPELVRGGVDGWLVPAGDVEALAAAMGACLRAPTEQLERMGEAAHGRVVDRHDIDHEAQKLLTLFSTSVQTACFLPRPAQ